MQLSLEQESVSLEENLKEVKLEAFCLACAKDILDKFKNHAKKNKVSIAEGMKSICMHECHY